MFKKNPLWPALGLALAVKTAYWALSRTSPFYEPLLLDPAYYDQWAKRIAAGEWSPATVFYGLPLYPYLLALIYKFTSASVEAVKWTQILAGLGTLYFVYRTAELFKGPRAGWIAAALGAVYGPVFFHEQIFIPEAAGLPLYAAAFYAACLLWRAPGLKPAALFGVLAGLACLTKAGILPFVLALPVLFLFSKRPVRPALIGLGVFILTISPVAAHNYFRGHDTVLLTSHSGFNFYIGNNERAEGVFVAPEGTGSNVDSQIQDSRAIAERAAGRPLKSSEVSAYWAAKAWEYIRSNPGGFLRLCARKFALFFDAREISDVDDYEFGGRFNPLLRFPWLSFAVLGPLALLGLIVGLGGTRERALVYLWAGGYLFGLMFFFVNARYRLPLVPLFLVLASLGLLAVLERVRARRWAALAVCAAVLAAGAVLTRLELVGTTHERSLISAGDVYHQKNDFSRAVEFYREAIAANPRSVKAHLAMGLVMAKMGDEERARDYYLTVIEEDPSNDQALNNLGFWYERRGRLEDAKTFFLRALAANPNSSQAHNNLGMVLAKLGDPERAIEEFERSLRINPRSARALTNLGLVLHRVGRKDEARQRWRQALEIDPDLPEVKRALSL